MTPTFSPGDQLLVSRARRPGLNVSRGDVVVVHDASGNDPPYLKRVIGLPGESVRQSDGALLVDGRRLVEKYLGGLPAVIGLEDDIWNLAEDECFVLGDNRSHSIDSRQLGPVNTGHIGGIVRCRYWPLHKLRFVRAPAYV